jgi:maltoporin
MARKFKLLAVAASLTAIGLPSAQAVDVDGYFRSGPARCATNSSTGDSVNRCQFSLSGAGAGAYYRLGNELDSYGEIGFATTGKAGGVDFKGKFMVSSYNGGSSTGASTSFNQMYAEGKGFDISPASTFWAGQRFYGRADVHIVDTFYTNLDGTGAGMETPVGGGTLAVAAFRDDASVGWRGNVDFSGLTVNPGGKLRVLATFTNSDLTAAGTKVGKSGAGITLQHNQDLPSLGGGNTAWVQFAQGSAGLNGNFGNATDSSTAKGFRFVESLTWQVGPLGGQAQAMYTDSKNNASVKTKTMSVGGRVSYALTNNFKLVADTGYSEAKTDGLAKEKLAKFTIAPTLATGPGFWNRPELRLFVTTAKWNSTANAYAGAAGLGGLGTKTTGTSYGFQAEMWF